MIISDLTKYLESVAPPQLQEDYDNAGLIIGSHSRPCTGVLCTLDVTSAVIAEAKEKNCNLIVAHHPLIFRGLKRINGYSEVELAVIEAIKQDVAIFAAHTNLDNIITGVNSTIADRLQLTNRKVLDPKPHLLKKLFTFIPEDHLDSVRNELFAAGAGFIGNYAECSFSNPGTGSFLGQEGTNPFSGEPGIRKYEKEVKLEVILPVWLEKQVVEALLQSHPYEEVAYDVVSLDNSYDRFGSGLIGDLPPIDESGFLSKLQHEFGSPTIRHTAFAGRQISRVAVCGGAGSFLISKALSAGADAFVTADLKYHEFFAPEGRMLLCDVGHYESEQYTTSLFVELLLRKFPTFAVLKSETLTNPVRYFTGT